jgi:hypothetical protein
MMNQELTQKIEFLLHSLSLKYHTKEDTVDQISNYHGKIKLVELTSELCIAAHQRGKHAHIMLLDKSIEQIKEEFNGEKRILPLVIFTIKHGPNGYVNLRPGKLDIIWLSKMQKECFDTFVAIQLLVYKP